MKNIYFFLCVPDKAAETTPNMLSFLYWCEEGVVAFWALPARIKGGRVALYVVKVSFRYRRTRSIIMQT